MTFLKSFAIVGLHLVTFSTFAAASVVLLQHDTPHTNIETSIPEEESKYKVCTTKYQDSDCLSIHANLTERYTDNLNLTQTRYNATCFLINISFPLTEPDLTGLLLNGFDDTGNRKCVFGTCNSSLFNNKDSSHLYVDNVVLPPGNYSLTWFIKESEEYTYGFFKVPEETIPHKTKRDLCEYHLCLSCFHQFFNNTGLLKFHYTNHEAYHNVNENIELWRYVKASNSSDCESMKKEDLPVDDMTVMGRPRDIGKVPLEFPNTATGCYLIKVSSACFYGFLWLESTNITDVNNWNTSILLIPRSRESSLEVQWIWPPFPYNFTRWQVELWSLMNFTVNCFGVNTASERVRLHGPTAEVTSNSYTFYNLSVGSYCARITPIDPRCPEDGCTPRSSGTAEIPVHEVPNVVESQLFNSGLMILLVFVGVISGFCIAFLCCKFSPISVRRQPLYRLVTIPKIEEIPVLLIWTKYNAPGTPEIEAVLRAFKQVLKMYCRCKVYDYLEPTKLPPQQRFTLLSNPIEWLDFHLKGNIKIIIVATEGAVYRQSLLKSWIAPKALPILGEAEDLDTDLFPYVLRKLQDSVDLASDYSRIFHVSFPYVSGRIVALEGVVSSERFNLPEHLRLLTLRLHGISEESANEIREPTHEEMNPLVSAIESTRII